VQWRLWGRGMWIFRGQDIPPIMKEECFDLDLYTWQKVDTSDAVRALAPSRSAGRQQRSVAGRHCSSRETYHAVACTHEGG
jgi:hypothetical protein